MHGNKLKHKDWGHSSSGRELPEFNPQFWKRKDRRKEGKEGGRKKDTMSMITIFQKN
jgi:hypothetical protein